MKELFQTVKFRLPGLIIAGLLLVASLVTILSYIRAVETIESSTIQKFESFSELYKTHLKHNLKNVNLKRRHETINDNIFTFKW